MATAIYAVTPTDIRETRGLTRVFVEQAQIPDKTLEGFAGFGHFKVGEDDKFTLRVKGSGRRIMSHTGTFVELWATLKGLADCVILTPRGKAVNWLVEACRNAGIVLQIHHVEHVLSTS